jgi:RNA polymerase sigma-70 factor (ECF subfamily)
VLQAVFLRLIRRDPSAEPLEDPQSYLRRAAVNASLDIVRSRQASKNVALFEVPAADDEKRELRDGLRRALAALNPRAAELFALRFFEGYTNPEIARIMRMSQVHVAVLLHRTRKQLQKEIKALGVRS